MIELAALFRRYGTDKDLIGYTPVYHTLLSRRRQERLVILEIGIGTIVPGVRSSMVGYALSGIVRVAPCERGAIAFLSRK